MSPSFKLVFRRYQWAIVKFEVYAIGCRDIELQRQAVRVSEKFHKWLFREAAKFGDEGLEEEATATYTIGCMTAAVRHLIAMWVEFKTGSPQKAWDELVDSQNYADRALQLHPFGQNAQGILEVLEHLEGLLFPPMVFASMGMVVGLEHCSICNDDIEKCDHVPGRLYKGRPCYQIVKEVIRMDHAAFVERPDDKKCIVTRFSVTDHKSRDRLSWRMSDSDSSADAEVKLMSFDRRSIS